MSIRRSIARKTQYNFRLNRKVIHLKHCWEDVNSMLDTFCGHKHKPAPPPKPPKPQPKPCPPPCFPCCPFCMPQKPGPSPGPPHCPHPKPPEPPRPQPGPPHCSPPKPPKHPRPQPCSCVTAHRSKVKARFAFFDEVLHQTSFTIKPDEVLQG